MFRSKKSTLIKKLLSLQEVSAKNSNDPKSQAVAKIFLKDISDITVLQTLLKVIKEGGQGTTCVVVNNPDSHITVCKLWRWPLYRTMPTLKRVPICNERCDGYECINPYHYCLTMKHGDAKHEFIRIPLQHQHPPTILYSKDLSDSGICIDMCSDVFKSEDRLEEVGWCNIAYWEHNQRIGALHRVTDPIVTIANRCSEGLDLSAVSKDVSCTRNDVTSRVRKHVGSGILFSLEEDGIWLYNRSEISIFVQSPTIPSGGTSQPSVHKVLPGYAINTYDARLHQTIARAARTIRLSFEKGWGPGYKRQYITDAPCWLELLLNNVR